MGTVPGMSMLRAVEDDPDERVRTVVRMLLGMHRMSEVELGRRLGLARTPIYNRMQGRTAFTVAEVIKMADLFDVPAEVFLAGPRALIAGVVTPRKSRPAASDRTLRAAA